MTSVRVFIATTDGPAEVQRITEEEPNVGSVICLDGKALALPISPDYEAFVRMPTGILEKAYGHPAYRMDVSTPISEGMSWQLGALVAHALFAADRLAPKGGQASQAVWLTGEVDRDLQVLPVEYVREKIRRSGQLLADLKAAGVPLILGVPRRNHEELDAGWLEQLGLDAETCRIVPLETADQILDLLGLASPFAKGPQAASARAATLEVDTRPAVWAFSTLALLALVVGAVAWWRYDLDPPARDPPAELDEKPAANQDIVQLSVAALEIRARAGSTCAAVNFGAAEAEVTETALSDHMPITTLGAEQLCGLRYRVSNQGGRSEVWVFGARSAKGSSSLKPKILAQARMVDTNGSVLLEIRLPRSLERPLLHRLAVIAIRNSNGGQKQTLKGFLTALEDPVGPTEWQNLLAGLQQGGLAVSQLSHELQP